METTNTTETANQPLMNATEAARVLKVPRWSLYDLVRRNAIPHVKLSERRIRFDPVTLQQWIKAGGNAQANAAQTNGDLPERHIRPKTKRKGNRRNQPPGRSVKVYLDSADLPNL